ncbi:MAG: aminotransferase class III-fold pyridoxal phosphate-dependent enzyme [Deltaproteobacteria bacterium]|nr:aminotransferase class III-fold pyridoxal phosphate-dependent enzyme [Deltaproteobacteria bacterium]
MKINISKSLQIQERAKNCMPGMTQLLSKRPDMFSLGVWPGYYSKAKGAEVWDLDGNHYIDMSISGIGANVLGYADPDVDTAVKNAIANGTSCSLNCPEEVELAEFLCELHPWAEMIRYARTGGEAMAVAVRVARARTRKDKIAFCGYHGWHDWYLAANLGTENALGEHLISGLNPAGVPKGLTGTALPFRYNHLHELESIIAANKDELAAIVMEPIRNEKPMPGFLEGVRGLADETNTVLIFDEISAGFRLNTGGAHLVIGDVIPDIAVFSKALGNGYPVAAVIGKADVMQAAQKTFISSTNWTERIGPTAAIAMIRKHKRVDAGKHLVHLGEQIQTGWKEIADKHGLTIEIGGMKPMSHFAFGNDKAQSMKAYFIQLMLEQGFLASNLFYAMYAHTDENVQDYLKATDKAFGEIVRSIEHNDIDKKLIGEPSSIGFKRLA